MILKARPESNLRELEFPSPKMLSVPQVEIS